MTNSGRYARNSWYDNDIVTTTDAGTRTMTEEEKREHPGWCSLCWVIHKQTGEQK